MVILLQIILHLGISSIPQYSCICILIWTAETTPHQNPDFSVIQANNTTRCVCLQNTKYMYNWLGVVNMKTHLYITIAILLLC